MKMPQGVWFWKSPLQARVWKLVCVVFRVRVVLQVPLQGRQPRVDRDCDAVSGQCSSGAKPSDTCIQVNNWNVDFFTKRLHTVYKFFQGDCATHDQLGRVAQTAAAAIAGAARKARTVHVQM